MPTIRGDIDRPEGSMFKPESFEQAACEGSCQRIVWISPLAAALRAGEHQLCLTFPGPYVVLCPDCFDSWGKGVEEAVEAERAAHGDV